MTRAMRRWWRASTVLALTIPLWLARRLRRRAQLRLEAAQAHLWACEAALMPPPPAASSAAAWAEFEIAVLCLDHAAAREERLIRRMRALSVEDET